MARQHNPNIDRQLAEAEALIRSGQLEAAKQLLGQIITRNPQNKKARKTLKALQAKAGVTLSRGDFDQIMRLASADKLDAACANASELIRLHPNQPALLNILGVLRARQGKFEEAVTHYRQALQLQADFSDALNNLGAAYNELGDFEKAAKCYQLLIQQGSKDPGIWHNLGNSLRGLKRYQESVQSYRQSLQLRPLSPDTYLNLGNSYADMGDTENAIASYESVLGLREDNIAALRNLASVLRGCGRNNAAASCYQRILNKQPKDISALRGLALTQSDSRLYTAALENLSTLLALQPDDPTARHLYNALKYQHSERAPEGYVSSLFDTYAAGFEQHLTETLSYNSPMLMRQLCNKLDMGVATGGSGLDLCCGTGLGGVAFGDMLSSLTGIDVSSKMLQEAKKKGIYSELIEGDVLKVLDHRDFQAQLILCFDALIYLGNALPVFKAVVKAAAPGGHFLFTTEHTETGDFELLPTARYAHSHKHIERCAVDAGLELLHFETAPLRKEYNQWLTGGFYCLKKPV
ncbi:MAG: tetratricopeptide repeat protein [Parahaliea sp.]